MIESQAKIESRFSETLLACIVTPLALAIFVFPNALRIEKLVLIGLALWFILLSVDKISSRLLVTLFFGEVITVAYLILGWGKAPSEAFLNVLAVYCVAPLFWVFFCNALLRQYGAVMVCRFIVFATIVCGVVSIAYVYLFMTDSVQYLSYLIEDPNVTLDDSGLMRARLHLFGSIVFAGSAVMTLSLGIGAGRLLRWCGIVSVLVIVFVSGRAALFYSVCLGVLVYLSAISAQRRKLVFFEFLLGMLVLFGFGAVLTVFGINFLGMLTDYVLKVGEFGGEERVDQALDLWRGVLESNFFGVGHGVPATVIRDEQFPWRYELLPLATLYRVGLLGLVVYAAPAALALTRYFSLRRARQTVPTDHFFFAGLSGLLIGVSTNPYLESVDFQWMYFLPVVYFEMRDKGNLVERS